VAGLVREGGLGDVRLVTGRYFQDWLLYDTDWNWRLEKDRAELCGPWRHRLALARSDDVPDRPPCRGGHGRPHDVHPGTPEAGRPVLTFATERAAETIPVEIQTRT